MSWAKILPRRPAYVTDSLSTTMTACPETVSMLKGAKQTLLPALMRARAVLPHSLLKCLISARERGPVCKNGALKSTLSCCDCAKACSPGLCLQRPCADEQRASEVKYGLTERPCWLCYGLSSQEEVGCSWELTQYVVKKGLYLVLQLIKEVFFLLRQLVASWKVADVNSAP